MIEFGMRKLVRKKLEELLGLPGLYMMAADSGRKKCGKTNSCLRTEREKLKVGDGKGVGLQFGQARGSGYR